MKEIEDYFSDTDEFKLSIENINKAKNFVELTGVGSFVGGHPMMDEISKQAMSNPGMRLDYAKAYFVK